MLDQRGQLLRAALGFGGLPRPSNDRTLWALRTWLDSHAFVQEHDHCGDLDSAVEGDRVWMTCTCGAVISRSADDD